MSLINQMLQDLEKRRASGTERSALPDQVRVLPREETHSMPWWLLGIGIAVMLIGVSAWQFNRGSASSIQSIAQTPEQPDLLQSAPLSGASAPRPGPERPQSSPSLAPAPAKQSSSTSRAVSSADVLTPRKATSGESLKAAPKEKLLPTPVAKASVLAGADPATAKPSAVVLNTEIAKSPFLLSPADAPKLSSTSPPAIAPLAPAGRPATSAPKIAEVLPETKIQAALANSQIDKRAQPLSPQQLAENEYREAANLLNQGRLADAQEGFKQALQINPAHTGARQGLFGLLIEAKKSAEAEQVLQDGLRLNLNQPGFALALASLQYERGSVTEAIDTLQRSAPAGQASADYLARLAGLLQRQSRHKEAVDAYQAALRLAPGSGVWSMGLGISLQASNRPIEAQDAFRRAKSSNSLNPELQAFVDQRLKQLQ